MSTRTPAGSIVAIQGCAGSYSHEAAQRAFGADVRILECGSFVNVLEALLDGRVPSAVLPIENTILGRLAATRELLARAPVRETGRVEMPVEHCLVVGALANSRRIRRVASHSAALAQCRRFLRAHPSWATICADDTAGAVRALAGGRLPADAAIASARAARLYGCRVLWRGIQDTAANITRFTVLERRAGAADVRTLGPGGRVQQRA